MHKSPDLSSSAEIIETKGVQTIDLDYYKGVAFMAYKNKNKRNGDFYLELAIAEARKEGKALSIQEIDDIMNGKAPSNNYQPEAGLKTKEAQEKQFDLQSSRNIVRATIETILAPLKKELEKLTQEIAQQIRQQMLLHSLFMPKFMNN